MCITTTAPTTIIQQRAKCPYPHEPVATAAAPLLLVPQKTSTNSPRQRCVYGYVGNSFDDAIKPLLLVYLVGSALGTLFFAVLSKDATRPFVLSTCGHLLPEMVLWTHMIFPPATTRANSKAMWTIRSIYAVGFAVLVLWPTHNNNHKMAPLPTVVYMILSGISDFLALWLGLVLVTRRTNRQVRKLGTAFFIHGAAFHFMAYEFFTPDKSQLWGTDALAGMGWILLLLVTAFTFFVAILPTFQEPLDLRDQAPTPQERRFLVGGVLTSFVGLPPLAAGSPEAAKAFVAKLIQDPSFFEPHSQAVALPYKVVFPLLGLMLTTYVLLTYVEAGLPILPMTTQQQQSQNKQSIQSSSSSKEMTSSNSLNTSSSNSLNKFPSHTSNNTSQQKLLCNPLPAASAATEAEIRLGIRPTLLVQYHQ